MTAVPSARRWPWLLSAVLLLVAGAAAAVSTSLFWLPCRGSMLDGSIVGPRRDPAFSDACLERMDSGTPFPHPAAIGEQATASAVLAAVAIALTALAWLPVALGLGWRSRSRLAVLLPVLATVLLAARSVPGAEVVTGPGGSTLLWMAVEALGLAAVLLVVRWEVGAGPALLIRLLVLSAGATAFGTLHQTGDYVLMIMTSSANWDVPPGTGYLTSALLVLAAAATVVLLGDHRWLPGGPGAARAARPQPDRSGLRV